MSKKPAMGDRKRGAKKAHPGKRKPDWPLVAKSVLAAYFAASSPRTTVAELTGVAVELIMDEGYGKDEAREAIARLSDFEDAHYH